MSDLHLLPSKAADELRRHDVMHGACATSSPY